MNFQGRILISAISPKGAAGKDGRLQTGDQILKVTFPMDDELGLSSHKPTFFFIKYTKLEWLEGPRMNGYTKRLQREKRSKIERLFHRNLIYNRKGSVY